MLSKDFDPIEQLYNPINNLTQMELMEKFNMAFYEGENLSKYEIANVFEEYSDPKFDDDESNNEEDHIPIDILVDYLTEPETPLTNFNFDFEELKNDFYLNTFNERLTNSDSLEDSRTLFSESEYTECSVQDECSQLSSLFNSTSSINELGNQDQITNGLLESLELGNFCDSLTPSPNQMNELACEICNCTGNSKERFTELTDRTNLEFNQFVRTLPVDDLSFSAQDVNSKNEFGHLIRNRSNDSTNCIPYTEKSFLTNSFSDNHVIATQNDNLVLHNPFFDTTEDKIISGIQEESNDYSCSGNEHQTNELICKWKNCYQSYNSQTALVKHIEKCHVDFKRSGDEFICYWLNCPRKTKPFNARYKLLIHMRVHSGEKPNKCPFKGCTKAFSRLENLKIHQRSHTGERPYICQFPSCPKSFSNSSDRAKHQRTHFDTKPYACQIKGCSKKYTDPSSLRKHVKNHTPEEQMQLKKKSGGSNTPEVEFSGHGSICYNNIEPRNEKVSSVKHHYATFEHNYSNVLENKRILTTSEVKRDLKNKISQRRSIASTK